MKIALVSVPVPDPVAAHEIYTTRLGFVSKTFEPENQLAIVAAPEDPQGTAILLEPCKGNFAEPYQQAAHDANMPIIVFSAADPAAELARLESRGVTLRPDLNRPEWGIDNVFEDGCGNFVMMEADATD
ncbi:MAG: VOC family protein [Pseudomonadota bacterium]